MGSPTKVGRSGAAVVGGGGVVGGGLEAEGAWGAAACVVVRNRLAKSRSSAIARSLGRGKRVGAVLERISGEACIESGINSNRLSLFNPRARRVRLIDFIPPTYGSFESPTIRREDGEWCRIGVGFEPHGADGGSVCGVSHFRFQAGEHFQPILRHCSDV